MIKLDHLNELIYIEDHPSLVTAERCFGRNAHGLALTLCCLPKKPARARRFSAGDRVGWAFYLWYL